MWAGEASGYLCPAGYVGVPQGMCQQAALAVMPDGWKQTRAHLIEGSWDHVSPGCSPQANENDFAAHFNTNANAAGGAGFPQVCMLADPGAAPFSKSCFHSQAALPCPLPLPCFDEWPS